MTNRTRDPEKAYRGTRLWLPKKHVNEKIVKGALTFQPQTGSKFAAFDETEAHLIVPRHFIPAEELDEVPYDVVYEEPPKFPRLPSWLRPRTTLRTKAEHGVDQQGMWRALVEGGDGGLVLKCGGGKTVIAVHAAMSVGYPAMFIAHNGSLLGQWKDRILEHTTAGEEHIGQIGDGKLDWEGKPFCLASVQTLWQRIEEGTLPEELRWYFGTMVYDEGHHLSAEKFNLTTDLCHGVRWYLTATPERTDGLEALYTMHFGPVLYRDLDQDLIPDAFFIKTGMRMSQAQETASKDSKGNFNVGRFHKALLLDEGRDRVVTHWVNMALDEQREVLLLTPSRDHLDVLAGLWDGPGVRVVHADVKVEDRARYVAEAELLLSIEELGIEGLDKPSLSVVALVCPMKNRNNLQQILGRIQRVLAGKQQAILLVFFDEHVPQSAKWARRMQSVLTSWGVPFRICDP